MGRTQERHRFLDRTGNPHFSASTIRITKAFAFWEWVIGEIKGLHPDVIFLAEAFTRPKVMHRLAKLGFTPVVHVFYLAHCQTRTHRNTSPT